MKTVVIGANGQLGRDLCPRLSGEVIPLTRKEVDLTNASLTRQTLEQIRPNQVINCAAYNFVDKAESEPDAAFATNCWAIRDLARICQDIDSVFVHFSTDYVFGLDASPGRPWLETDAPGPISVYGTSKLAGEYFTLAICAKSYVIRTCGLYGVWGSGGKGGNFVETMLRLAGQGKSLRVVDDQVCTPTYTVDLAYATLKLIETNAFGLYHITNEGACSWHALAREAFRLEGITADLTPIPTEEYPTPARRPRYSVLSKAKLHLLGVPSLRPWQEALAEYLRERKSR